MASEEVIWDRRKNLTGVILANHVLEFWPFNQFQSYPNQTAYNETGLFFDIFSLLQEELGFEIVSFVPSDGQWGAKKPDGTWTGLVGILESKTGDVTFNGLTIMEERAKVMDFTFPIYSDKITLIGNNGGKGTIYIWVYMSVFTVECWFAILTFSFFLALGFSAIATFSVERLHVDSDKFGFLNGVALTYILLFQQDYGTLVKDRVKTKILFYTTCLATFLLYGFYTADLTSKLSTIYSPEIIHSFSEVLPNDYQVFVQKDISYEVILSSAQPPSPLHAIYQETMKNNPEAFFKTQTDGIRILESETKALLFQSTGMLLGKDSVAEPLKLHDMMDENWGFGLQKDSEFREIFNFYLLKLEQTGAIEKLKSKWLRKKKEQEVILDSAAALGYGNLVFPFVILVFGMFGGIALGLAETIHVRVQKLL